MHIIVIWTKKILKHAHFLKVSVNGESRVEHVEPRAKLCLRKASVQYCLWLSCTSYVGITEKPYQISWVTLYIIFFTFWLLYSSFLQQSYVLLDSWNILETQFSPCSSWASSWLLISNFCNTFTSPWWTFISSSTETLSILLCSWAVLAFYILHWVFCVFSLWALICRWVWTRLVTSTWAIW